MGTNYYARIIPSKARQNELTQAIKDNEHETIKELVDDMYGSLRYEDDKFKGGIVHLGKMSAGWKFLWNPNVYVQKNFRLEEEKLENGHYKYNYIPEPSTLAYLYPLTKKGIIDFVMRKDVEIIDEYGESQIKVEFLDDAFNWTTWRGEEAWDSATYHRDHPEEKTWKCESELIDLLENEGIEFISDSRSDFYSDGLRFATSTEFS